MEALHRFDNRLARPDFRWEGLVSAVFGRAAVVERTGEAGPARLTLLESKEPLQPYGLCLGLRDDLPISGCRVRVCGRSLTFVSPAGRLHQRRLVGAGCGLAIDVTRRGSCRDLAAQLAVLGARKVYPEELVSVVRGLTEHDGPGLRASVRALVGRGPGSTPTGDDLLTGVAAMAWRALGPGWIPGDGVTEYRAELRRAAALERTTPTGCAMLEQAAQGVFVEPLRDLVQTLGDPVAEPAALQQIAGRLMRIGGQSGTEMLTGVTALAKALVNRIERNP